MFQRYWVLSVLKAVLRWPVVSGSGGPGAQGMKCMSVSLRDAGGTCSHDQTRTRCQ